jgi:hypothetical protein
LAFKTAASTSTLLCSWRKLPAHCHAGCGCIVATGVPKLVVRFCCRKFTGDNWEMSEQLAAAFPIHTYPHVLLTPDGGLAVSAGKLMVRTGSVV